MFLDSNTLKLTQLSFLLLPEWEVRDVYITALNLRWR
ncbi:hypothetical protein SAMN04488132_103483 [Sediminibacterium ginsengisoli]|uniref:Uncharacterized protein n=1 Tax=Sediminibacterium ginsengisoli TaxID=413434 RepID=A0A1T4MNZ4_9BACT|nr:hypothetical protein SAMN04488132_103483 [Sediminibacterium ginsengisoli]